MVILVEEIGKEVGAKAGPTDRVEATLGQKALDQNMGDRDRVRDQPVTSSGILTVANKIINRKER